MTWINSLNSTQWLVLLAIPPLVVLLYFLKLKRSPIRVPSTFLWRKAIEDSHANSLWQRLRKSLLLVLQLLFLLTLILACLRPGRSGTQSVGQRTILMIDNSASMSATDVTPNRLEVAKSRARELVGAMESNDVAMVIAFSDRADVRQGFSSDRNRLIDAIDKIAASSRTTDLNGAMRAASGLANPGRVSFNGTNDIEVANVSPTTVTLYSDGGFASLDDFAIGNLSIRYVPIGSKIIDNLSIEAFSILRNEENEDQSEGYARIASFSSKSVEVLISLYRDESLLDATTILIDPGKEVGVTFDLANTDPTSGVFRVVLERQDQLAIDNIAYAAPHPSKPSDVLLVTPGNKPLATALATPAVQAIANTQIVDPSVLIDAKVSEELMQSDKYDLIIFDQCSPSQMPKANSLFIGSIPPSSNWSFGETSSPINLIDSDRTHPMMMYLELNSIRIVEGHSVTPPEGGKILIRSDTGPALAIAPRGPYQDAVLGFGIIRQGETGPIVNTDWGIKRSFPLFVYACIEFLSRGFAEQTTASIQPGQPVSRAWSNRAQQFEVTAPNGKKSRIDQSPSGQYVYTDTETAGAYLVHATADVNVQQSESTTNMSTNDQNNTDQLKPNRLVDVFTANLFSPRESNITVQRELSIGGEAVMGTSGRSASRIEYWRWILFAGFCLMVFEWFVYHRRHY